MDLFSKTTYTHEDIQQIIDLKLEESLKLEFKSADALKNNDNCKKEIAKDVSAFANSDGGIIVYGLNEENHVAASLAFVDGNITPKEWLENVIVDNIHQKIENLEIIPVRFDGDIKKTVYIVKIPVSPNSPHMCGKDSKYYRRFNFKSTPMEEYEVRNLYYAQRNSIVTIDSIKVIDDKENYSNLEKYNFQVKVTAGNNGTFVAEKYKVVCKIISSATCNIYTSTNNNLADLDEFIKVSSTIMVPIFPDETIHVMTFNIACEKKNFDYFINNTQFLFYTFSGVNKHDLDYDIKSLILNAKNRIDSNIDDELYDLE